MVRGSNSITINTTVELKQLIDHCKVMERQGLLHDSFYIARAFLVQHKDDFISINMQLRGMTQQQATALYEKELERWSRTQNELRDDAEKRKKAEESAILEKAQQIKLRQIEPLLKEKAEILNKDPHLKFPHNQTRLPEIEQQLKILGYEEGEKA